MGKAKHGSAGTPLGQELDTLDRMQGFDWVPSS